MRCALSSTVARSAPDTVGSIQEPHHGAGGPWWVAGHRSPARGALFALVAPVRSGLVQNASGLRCVLPVPTSVGPKCVWANPDSVNLAVSPETQTHFGPLDCRVSVPTRDSDAFWTTTSGTPRSLSGRFALRPPPTVWTCFDSSAAPFCRVFRHTRATGTPSARSRRSVGPEHRHSPIRDAPRRRSSLSPPSRGDRQSHPRDDLVNPFEITPPHADHRPPCQFQ